jgi:FMN phosphatase YigB (HAD superfamily)
MYRTIIFDMGGIFYKKDYTPQLEKKLEVFFEANGAIRNDYSKLWLKMVGFGKPGQIKKVRLKYLAALGLKRSLLTGYIDIVNKDREKVKPLDRNAPRYLKNLVGKGFRIVILTNTLNTKADRIKFLKRLGLAKYIDDVFCSSEIGYIKPNKGAYLYVLNRLKISPGEAIFVGHDDIELEGAAKAGLTPVRFSGSFRKLTSDIYKTTNGAV